MDNTKLDGEWFVYKNVVLSGDSVNPVRIAVAESNELAEALADAHNATRWRGMDSAPKDGSVDICIQTETGFRYVEYVYKHFYWRKVGSGEIIDESINKILCWRPRAQPPSEKELEGLE